ncbi:two-component sensor histidine kinase [Mesorhizobium loti]|nr:ATP-binding protein [Mesorhizobium loti]PLP57898.1 two-component sensor histidine kinase [Mesorhizobium loti]
MRRNQVLVAAALVVAIAVIFVADTVTDYAIAAAVFYTAVILFATRLLPARSVVALACVCIALTVLSVALTHSGAYEVGIVNTAISIVAIGVTTYLSLKLVTAEAAAHESRERLLRMARVTSLGELTASIAHEVNQPLAAVVTSAGACKRWLAQEPPNIESARRTVDRIVEEANRASAVITRVRGLASNKASEKAPFDLNVLVREIVTLAHDQIDRRDIALRLYLPESLPMVMADRVQIGQVVGNLVLNALEAIAASSGQIRDLEIATENDSHDRIRFSVADTGIGLRAGEAEHLFDAFWTTKKDGIGLGLTISRSIIEANGGRIWAGQNEGGGAVLSFSLPVAEDMKL